MESTSPKVGTVFKKDASKASHSSKKRLRTITWICAGCTIFWIFLYWFSIVLLLQKQPIVSPLYDAEFLFEDFRVRHGKKAPKNPDIVFLGVNKSNFLEDVFPGELEEAPDLKLICQNFPWDRAIWGKAIDRLIQAGAKVVILDFLFTNPGTGDAAFSKALAQHRSHVVIGANIVDREVNIRSQTQTAAQIDWPTSTLVQGIEESRDYVALVNYWPDQDGKVRSANYADSLANSLDPEDVFPSLALMAAMKGGDIKGEILDYYGPRGIRFVDEPGLGFGFYSIYDIFSPAIWKSNFKEGKFFEGKYVLIGPAGNWAHDYHPTPFQKEMLGPEIHLNALNALLGGHFIQRTVPFVNYLVIIAFGTGALIITVAIKQPLYRIIAIAASLGCYFGFSFLMYDRFNTQIVSFTPMICLFSGGLISLTYEFVLERLEKARVRSTLERYVSKNVVAEMLDHGEELQAALGGLRKPVTVLFSDVRGFTTMTEAASDSQAFVAQLNEYLSAMVAVVFRHNGTLDKFIGDAVMAVWGNTTSSGPADDAKRAAQTALEMLQELEKLNQKWAEEKNWKPFKIGIGLNHGEVICGNMGSLERMEFTVIGDAVNLASRLEGTTKEYGITLMIGESVAPYLMEDYMLQTVDYIQVKGKTKPVDTFTLLPFSKETVPNEVSNALKDYETGIVAYRAGKFEEARQLFVLACNVHPIGILAKEFAERCENLIAHPPEGPWTGVYIMTKK